MTTAVKLPFDEKYVSDFSSKNNEPAWMKELRVEALDLAERLELPKPDKTKITRWNFTEFKHLADGDKIENLNDAPDALKSFIDVDNENVIILRNQNVAYSSLNKALADKGVILTDIFSALENHGELVKKYFMTDGVQVNEHKLTALHAALMNGGVFVYVPKGVKVEEPLQAIFWQEDKEVALFNHVLVVAEDDSELTYVENYVSENKTEQTVANIIEEVYVGANADVSFGAVDHFEAGTTTYINRRGIVGAHADLDWALGQMNEGHTVSENDTHLVGDGGNAIARTVTVGRGKQTQNFTTRTVHFGLDTNGEISQRGVMNGNATAIFNAIGKIERGASRSNAEQESRLLMLSGRARGDANPILLIDENDVMAGHAASVGRVDDMQLYYLQSRGITKEEAERLIIHGFLAPVVGELPIQVIKDQMTLLIEGKIK